MLLWPLVGLFTALFFYYYKAIRQFLCDRRDKICLGDAIAGPKGLPILGNTLDVPKTSFEWAEKLVQWANECAAQGHRVMKIWIGGELFVFPLNGEAVKPIVDSNTEITKGKDYDFFLPWLGTGLLLSTGTKWKTRRKMLTPTFHFQMLEGYVEVFNRNSKILTQIIERYSNDGIEIDIFPYIKRCALDIICETAMGTTVNAQMNSDSEYVRAVEKISVLGFNYSMKPINWFTPYYYASGQGFEKDRLVKILTDFTKKVIKERVESREQKAQTTVKRMAFLDMLLDMQETNQLTYEDIREEVDTFMFEGHDTTSSGIGWTLWCLATHPEIQKKVHEELDEHFGDSDREVTTEDLKKLKYLERCIKEAMRLFPPVPMVERTLQHNLKMGGVTAPKGSHVVICPLMIHRNTMNYKKTDTYDPDNFLSERISERHPYDYIPFSAGPRNCIGQRFAQHEEKTMITWILRKYRISTKHNLTSNRFGTEVILRPDNGFPMRLSKRL
uniref:Cytochrome P450 n=1 Tax=Steinernema glaseri TaxID=37863 RepID=A0A1I7Y7R7_9BILA